MTHAKDGNAATSEFLKTRNSPRWRTEAVIVSTVLLCLGARTPQALSGPIHDRQVAMSEDADGLQSQSDSPATRASRDPLLIWPLTKSSAEPGAAMQTEPPGSGTPTIVTPPEPARSATLSATVTVMSNGAEQIRLVKDKSAVVRTTMPVSRAAITAPDIANVLLPSPREIIVSGKAFGTTQLTLWTADDQQKTYDVIVELDLPMLEDAIKQLAPQARVKTRLFAGTLVLSGRVPDSLTAERIEALSTIVHPRVANHLNVGGVQQTLLRCTVAEVNKEAIRQLAVNWALGGGDVSRDFFFANNLGQLNPSVFGNNAKPDLLAPIPIGRNNNFLNDISYFRGATALGPNANFTLGFPRAELQFFLQALRDNSLFRVLAEPNAVAVNGQEAMFLSGGEFPIPVSQGGSTAGAITIQFKQFGIQLRFTPTTLENGVIRLRVIAEVSDLVPAGTIAVGGLPVFSLTSRRVESTVDVGSGQTFAIGGLLSDRVQALSSKIPGLGDIPVLGALFSSVRYQRNETELVILVTPEAVAPMDPHQVAPVPGQDMTDPNDFELFAMQQLEGARRPEPEPLVAPRHDYPARPTPAHKTAVTMDLSLRGSWGHSDAEDM